MPNNRDDWDEDQDFGYEPDDDDDLVGYDATEEEGRRRPLMILSVIVLLAVFGGVVYLAYSQGFKQGAGNGSPPLIRADTSPVKVPPENPGGVAIPHQDKTVYERISGGMETHSADEVEQLLPRAEEPMPMAQTPDAPADQPVTEPLVSAAPVAPVDTVPSVPAAVAEVPATIPDTVPAPVVTATSGGYVVQLAAFRDEASALSAFSKLQKKYGAELSGTQSDIQRADLGDKGIYYRLRAGYMDKAAAVALCDQLSKQGQSCFVRAK